MPEVSICIPTYKRPDLVRAALESCFAQTFTDFEVVISDDSPDDLTANMVRSLETGYPIRYVHNRPGLGQAGNVNQLFNLAQGEFLVLLHDDDFLMPNALADLIAPLREHSSVVAAFGKQYLASHDGTILGIESEALCRRNSRTDDRANKIQRSEWSALAKQFPADGYMVRSAAARSTLYRDDPEVGEACDGEFCLRLAKLGAFYFVGNYVSVYRETEESISTRGLRVLLSNLYFITKKVSVSTDLESFREARLKLLAPAAVNGCLLASSRRKALGILLSKDYPWRQEFLKGAIQLGLVLAPKAATVAVIERKSRARSFEWSAA